MLVPPYHPASNGAAKRVVQTVKNKLKKSGSGNFQMQISRFLFHYRTTPHEVTGRPPCELLTGRMFKTPLDVLRPSLGTPWVPASVVDVTPSSASVRFEDGTLGNRHSDHLRLVQTETLASPETANAAAPPQLEPPLHHAPVIPEVPHQEQLPGTSFSGSSCATESDRTPLNRGVHVNSDFVVPTPSTPKLRRGTRTRKPVNVYSP
nr:uncharacterized protein LOC119174041 [Rhipicephalus microplus]